MCGEVKGVLWCEGVVCAVRCYVCGVWVHVRVEVCSCAKLHGKPIIAQSDMPTVV